MQTRPTFENPNSSGQGYHPSEKTHPFREVMLRYGYNYSHSTAIGYQAEDGQRWFIEHCFHQTDPTGMPHTVSLRTNENNSNHEQHWRTSCGGTSGKMGTGKEALMKHLDSKQMRYQLAIQYLASDFVKYRVCGRRYNRTANFPAMEFTSYRQAMSINLWNGTVWGIREDGSKKLIKRVTN